MNQKLERSHSGYLFAAADSTRAGTLIHEATHYLGNTGDYIENGQMLKGNQHETDKSGCKFSLIPFYCPGLS